MLSGNPLNRFFQKQRLKREYAKAARTAKAAGSTAQATAKSAEKTVEATATAAKKAAEKAKEAAEFVARHWKGVLVVLAGFLLIVMLISIVFFLFIRVDNRILQLLLRLVLIPVIAGVSYEFIRLAGRSDHMLVNLFSKPGLLLQRITTREPDDSMIEVGIASVEAVFDWKAYVKEIREQA